MTFVRNSGILTETTTKLEFNEAKQFSITFAFVMKTGKNERTNVDVEKLK